MPADHTPPMDLADELPDLEAEGYTVGPWQSSAADGQEPFFFALVSKDGYGDFVGITWSWMREKRAESTALIESYFAITRLVVDQMIAKHKVTHDDLREFKGVHLGR